MNEQSRKVLQALVENRDGKSPDSALPFTCFYYLKDGVYWCFTWFKAKAGLAGFSKGRPITGFQIFERPEQAMPDVMVQADRKLFELYNGGSSR